MVKNERNALLAINGLLVVCRSLAHEGKSDELAIILDAAEYLPMLMLDIQDQTEIFRGQLMELAKRFPILGYALDRFDGKA